MGTPVPPFIGPSAADLKDQIQDTSDDVKKLKQSFKGLRTTQSGISNTLAWSSHTATAASASVAALTVGLSLFKVDEKGITILGATREFPWKKKIDKLQEKIESREQRQSREQDERYKSLLKRRESHIERLNETEADVRRIKDGLRRAALAAERERDRLQADPRNRTDRGIDATRPIVRGVTSDVRVLRSAVTALTDAFA
ncbi:hypothetical protein [Streptomyces sp. NPDC059063]|uniref:hypothetical protein n=1 Tax=unclassified Streptomyces TaxID=2593676 RepID=UPI0036BC17E2